MLPRPCYGGPHAQGNEPSAESDAQDLARTVSSHQPTHRRLRVEEVRWSVGAPWLCPPFPASCPFRVAMVPSESPPSQTSPCRFPAASSSSVTHRLGLGMGDPG